MSTVQSVPADELSPCQPDQLTTKQQNIRFNFQLWCVWVQELFVSTIGALLSSSIRGNTFHFLSCRWWWEGSSRQTINLSDVFVRCCPWTITTQSWCHYYTSLEYITFFRFCKQKLGFTNMVITAFKMSETVGHIELLIVPSKTRQDCRWGGWWDVNGEKGRVSRGDYSGGEDGRYWGIMNAVKIWDPEIFFTCQRLQTWSLGGSGTLSSFRLSASSPGNLSDLGSHIHISLSVFLSDSHRHWCLITIFWPSHFQAQMTTGLGLPFLKY